MELVLFQFILAASDFLIRIIPDCTANSANNTAPSAMSTGSSCSLGSILNVEASHLALSKTENVSDRLVFKPVRLPLERFAFEIADGLPDLRDDRAIRSSMKAQGLDVRTDHGPLARPVRAYGLAAMDVATIHTVGPGNIVGERGQHAVYVPRVKAIVDAFKDFDVIVHRVSPCIVRVLRYRPTPLHMHVCIRATVGARGECDGPRCALDAWALDQSRGARVRPPERSPPQAAWLRRWTSASSGRAPGGRGKHAA